MPSSSTKPKPSQNALAKEDYPRFFLLVLLYFLQGIPVGLTFGTIPFLLKSIAKETSFASLGFFSIATYPYSLKIFWSPIVDSLYFKKLGRRRSWIIPIQFISGLLLIIFSYAIKHDYIFPGIDSQFNFNNNSDSDKTLEDYVSNININTLTFYFGVLIFLCATQDIAVDGWALTILSQKSISYASTAQTVGLNTGYFLSFTVFIAMNSKDFANKYLRSTPLEHGLISLNGYMKFAGILYILTTLYVMFFTTENVKSLHNENKSHLPTILNERPPEFITIEKEPEFYSTDSLTSNSNSNSNSNFKKALSNNDNLSNIKLVYKNFWKILNLKNIQILSIIHLFSKFAFQCNESSTNLKLLELGFKREDLAVTVLIDFPFEIIFGYYVAKWSSDVNHDLRIKDNDLSSNSNSTTNTNSRYYRSSLMERINLFLVGEYGVLTPWLYGFLGRLVAAIMGNFVLYFFPEDGIITKKYFLLVILQHLLGSFMSTVQFVSISAFHSRIADPKFGGTYMTLLNTLSNLGGTWPRIIIMWMISYFSIYDMVLEKDNVATLGTTIIRDGYYITNIICIVIGIILYFGYFKYIMGKLQKLRINMWRS
ncbi:hypothetical protein TBLA_0F02510 [Henningerozyma blattae CBS 6284]|uniref:Major facilitator superfamily (MFS) profile domain-containing protein n=1 Tax=Henningerozyma blattae (strain ATCC 34711 / CBS 6284 / DSM 70876 / NBRC 10599 / NRRL Y-10934 / UCD 77-7) TaxID=1071380 RepID=I2H5Y9_HENB6|nr:hypothetical protein TBLA_0F02510 [Tetrapisispora blattae CBS 6284]CCH61791.1 hypothetical protein TBLA_0F02510 [Tetrapisispora blattae CBS 6284]